jgi:O-antigen/teichoic acid export membrane protein
MAMVYVGLTSLITDFGLSSAVVALKALSREQIEQLNTVAVALGVLAVTISLALAFPISWFFRSPPVALVVMVLSGTLLIDALRSVPAALLAKDMRFKFLAVVEGMKGLIVAAATVALALAGFRYWALVTGIVLTSVLSSVFVLLRNRVAFRQPRRGDLSEAAAYTRDFLLGNISWYAYSNSDFVVAGRVLGKAPLGEYTYAWTMATAPIEKVASVLNRVLPSLYSAVSGDAAAMRRYLVKITQLMALIVCPVAFGVSLVAREFVLVVLGAKWVGSVGPLRILAFYGVLQAMSLLLPPILMVTGHIRALSRLGMLSAVVLPMAFVLGGIAYGTIGIAAVWITIYPILLFVLARLCFRIIELDYREYIAAYAPAVVSCLCMAVAVLGVGFGTARESMLTQLITKVTVGAVTYCAVLYIGWRRPIRSMIVTLRLLM